MGWQYSSVSFILHRHVDRASNRRGVLQAGIHNWYILTSFRNIHGIFVYSVLATFPGTGGMCWPWQWLPLLSNDVNGLDIFLEEEEHSYWGCCMWECHRGTYLPCHGSAAPTEDRIWLDYESNRFCRVFMSNHMHYISQAKTSTSKNWIDRRMASIQGDALYFICGWNVFGKP